MHQVSAFVQILDDEVAGIVDDVGVVAGAAEHGVGAGGSIEPVVGRVANQNVV